MQQIADYLKPLSKALSLDFDLVQSAARHLQAAKRIPSDNAPADAEMAARLLIACLAAEWPADAPRMVHAYAELPLESVGLTCADGTVRLIEAAQVEKAGLGWTIGPLDTFEQAVIAALDYPRIYPGSDAASMPTFMLRRGGPTPWARLTTPNTLLNLLYGAHVDDAPVSTFVTLSPDALFKVASGLHSSAGISSHRESAWGHA